MADEISFCCGPVTRHNKMGQRMKNLSHPPFLQNYNFWFEESMQTTFTNGFLVLKFLQILYCEVRKLSILLSLLSRDQVVSACSLSYKGIFNILVCRYLDVMYTSILQFLWCLTKLVEGQTMEKTELYQKLWLKIELVSRSQKWQFWTCSKEQCAALLTHEVNSSKNHF